jgi:hypothetical protein
MTAVIGSEGRALAALEAPHVAFGRLAELAARACDGAQQALVEHQISMVVALVRLRTDVEGLDGTPVSLGAIDPLLTAAADTGRPLPQRVTVLARLYDVLNSR